MQWRAVVAVGALLVAAGACSGSDDGAGAVPVAPTSAAAPLPTAPPVATEPSVPSTTESPAAAASAPVMTTAPHRTYDFSALGPIVESFVADYDLGGAGLVVVERDDGIVHQQYWGEFSADRVSLTASSSKMLTAGVLMHLADDGLLDIDRPIAEYVDWAAGHNPQITAAQLLSNSAGLVGLGPNPGYPPYLCQFLPDAEIEACAATAWASPDDDDDIVAPDTEFRYGGVQWQIAGAVAETVSGKSWAELIDEIYVEPCGVDSLGYTNHWATLGGGGFTYPPDFDGDVSLFAPTENPHMEGGAYIAPPDYAELLLMHLRNGMCGGTRVLSEDALAQMHADRIGPAYGGTTQTGSGYGLGWWVYQFPDRIDDPGAYGSFPWLDLHDGYGAYLVIEADATLGALLAGQLFGPVDSAIRVSRIGEPARPETFRPAPQPSRQSCGVRASPLGASTHRGASSCNWWRPADERPPAGCGVSVASTRCSATSPPASRTGKPWS